ncbi:MAG: capsid protein [Carnobacterium inhibens]|uniref:capsid protein n=1 Tax=Carnobacterium sp. TaxID=48221 RepID=UPI003315D561
MAIKLYTSEYMSLFQNIFAKRARFLRSFGGSIQVTDGVKDTDNFLHLKTTDSEVVIQTYNTGADVAFGTGTGNTSRFGPRKEIKAVDTTVPYDGALSIHEGVDNVTVNDIPDQVVAERLEAQALAWTEHVNKFLFTLLSTSASETLAGVLSEDGVTALFAAAHKKMVNNNVSSAIPWVAYVNPDVFNFLVDSRLATTGKNSSANIDSQTLYAFKGFILEETPDAYFATGEQAVFAADNVGVVGTGFSMVRTIDSEDFYGVAIQGAAKYGKYIPDNNKKAILKAKLTEAEVIPAG